MRKQEQRTATAAWREGGRDARLRAALGFGILALAAAALLASATPSRAATYRWVDEKGVVHYSDKLPPEAVNKANTQLTKEGIPIRKTDSALTPEQRRALELDDERQRKAARQREEVARRDRALVASYTSEAEIDLARSRSMLTINNAINSSLAYTEQLNKRRAEAESKKAQNQGKPLASTIDRELESIDTELARQADLVTQKKREAASIEAKYDADKARWRELVAAKTVAEPAAAAPAPAPAKK